MSDRTGFNVKDMVLLTVFFLYFQLYLSENMLLKNASPLARKHVSKYSRLWPSL